MILFRQVGFKNKGAELMLRSMIDQGRKSHPGEDLAIDITSISGSYLQRAELGLFSMPKLWRFGCQFGRLANYAPAKIINPFGIVKPSDVTQVWDGAGYAYTDKWGRGLSAELLDSVTYYKRRGAKFIFLPQAFGPFEDSVIAKNVKTSLELADQVWARDKTSFDHIKELSPNDFSPEKYHICPDFTAAIRVDDMNPSSNMAGIVPNMRLHDKHGISIEDYVSYLCQQRDLLIEMGYKVVLFVHEDDDEVVAEKINNVEITRGSALQLKSGIGRCELIISSRYHACVSALSQGVPTISLGWAHKYEELHRDWACEEFFARDFSEIEPMICQIQDQKVQLKERLFAQKKLVCSQVDFMWAKVHGCL